MERLQPTEWERRFLRGSVAAGPGPSDSESASSSSYCYPWCEDWPVGYYGQHPLYGYGGCGWSRGDRMFMAIGANAAYARN